jgi:hypothetical protein
MTAGRIAGVAMLVALLLLAATGPSEAEIAERGTLRIKVNGGMSPKALPRDESRPISVAVGGRISTTDGSRPARLTGIEIEINRHGRLDSSGLPVCRYGDIHPASTARALAACRPALVGQGHFAADILLPGQQPYPARGRLLVFNGRRGPRPVLYAHIYSPHPFATSFVFVFRVSRAPSGTFGTTLTASLPQALGEWGHLTGIEMRLARRYRSGGRSHSFVSASCPAPEGSRLAVFPMARTSFRFDGGTALAATLIRSCAVRGGASR